MAGLIAAFMLGALRVPSAFGDEIVRSSTPSTVSLRQIARVPIASNMLSGQTIRSVAWSPDGRRLAMSLGWGIEILVLDTTTWREVSRLKWQYDEPDRDMAFLSNSEIVTAPAENSPDSPIALAVHDIETGRLIREMPRSPMFAKYRTRQIAVTTSRRFIGVLAKTSLPVPVLFDASSGTFISRLATPPESWSPVLAAGPGNKLAIAVSRSGEREAIYVIDAASNTVDRILAGHVPSVGSIAWSPDGQLIASGVSIGASIVDGKLIRDEDPIRVWDVATGEMIASFTGTYDPVARISWHPSSKVFATDSAKGGEKERGSAIRLWSVTRKEMLFEYKAPGSDVINGLSFDVHTGRLIWGRGGALYVFEVLGLP